MLVFASKLGWLPTAGWNDGALANLVLPVTVLALPQIAIISRLTRAGMIEVLHSNYVRTARAKGLPERRIVTRHALRAALLPLVSYLGPACAGLITGSLVVEQIFNLPGLGKFFVISALQRDYTRGDGHGDRLRRPDPAAEPGRRPALRACSIRGCGWHEPSTWRPARARAPTRCSAAVKGRSLWDDARRRLFRNKAAVASMIVLGAAGAGRRLRPAPGRPIAYDEINKTDVWVRAAARSGHLLGTDALGRDLLARLLIGLRVSLAIGAGGHRWSRWSSASPGARSAGFSAAGSTR